MKAVTCSVAMSIDTLSIAFLLLGLVALVAFAAWINDVMIALVRDSRIPLDLFHAQSLDGTSIITLVAIAFLLFSWLLLADALVRWVALGLTVRVLAITALLFFSGIHMAYHFLGSYDSVLALEAADADAELKSTLDAQRAAGTRYVQDVPSSLRAVFGPLAA